MFCLSAGSARDQNSAWLERPKEVQEGQGYHRRCYQWSWFGSTWPYWGKEGVPQVYTDHFILQGVWRQAQGPRRLPNPEREDFERLAHCNYLEAPSGGDLEQMAPPEWPGRVHRAHLLHSARDVHCYQKLGVNRAHEPRVVLRHEAHQVEQGSSLWQDSAWV